MTDIWAPQVTFRNEWKGQPFFSVISDREFDREDPECLGWTAALDGRRRLVVRKLFVAHVGDDDQQEGSGEPYSARGVAFGDDRKNLRSDV